MAVSLVGEGDISLFQACEKLSGRSIEKCDLVNDKEALKVMKRVIEASKVVKNRMEEQGFHEIVEKQKIRKAKARKEREKLQRAAEAIKLTGSKKKSDGKKSKKAKVAKASKKSAKK